MTLLAQPRTLPYQPLRRSPSRVLGARLFHALGLSVVALSSLALNACGKTPKDVRSPEETQATEYSLADTGATPEERAILAHVETLPAHRPTKVQSVTVTVGDLYNAASGHVCREVTLTGGAHPDQRLACKVDDSWFFTEAVWDTQTSDVQQHAPTSSPVPVGGSPTPEP